MNERIRELLIEAHKQTKGGIYNGHPSEWTEKFAELIVREFIKIADDEASRYYNMNEDDCASAMLNYMELVKQHFGVEE